MARTIANAANVPLNVQSGSIPNVGGAILDWLQQMVFTIVSKHTVGYQLIETSIDVSFWGVVQPLSGRQLQMKPEGQRSWKWISIFAQCDPEGALLTLKPDEVIRFLNKNYRIINAKNYSIYGYIEYDLVEDYIGSGPPTL